MRDKKEVLLESATLKAEEVVFKNENDESQDKGIDLRIAYVNIDRVLSARLMLNYYQKENEPDILCLTVTKLNTDLELMDVENGKYRVWRRERNKQTRVGVMMFVIN